MKRLVVAAALALALAIAGAVLMGGGAEAPAERPTGIVTTCAQQSGAEFPRAFTSPRNLVVGPLAMMGGAAFTPPDVVRRFGGNKFPLLVRAGHTVTVELTRRTRRVAALGYGRLPQGEVGVEDGHRVVTFRSCRAQDAISEADGEPVTFWSGFVLARRPACVPLRVWVDGERRPRRARIELGRRCR